MKKLFEAFSNRKAKKEKPVSVVPLDLERIVQLSKENDIMEFEIIANQDVIKIGSSSDCKYSSSVFFDKRYYIGKIEFLTAEEFEKELLPYTADGKINVITIDGIKAEKW